jgi:hypothetical protein
VQQSPISAERSTTGPTFDSESDTNMDHRTKGGDAKALTRTADSGRDNKFRRDRGSGYLLSQGQNRDVQQRNSDLSIRRKSVGQVKTLSQGQNCEVQHLSPRSYHRTVADEKPQNCIVADSKIPTGT